MKSLQNQYNLITEGKGHKDVFLKEAKRLYPNLLTNAATFDETVKIFKNKHVISENYIDLQPINSFERPLEKWEEKFKNFELRGKTRASDPRRTACSPAKIHFP